MRYVLFFAIFYTGALQIEDWIKGDKVEQHQEVTSQRPVSEVSNRN